jgi:hypothetical protein
VLFAEPLKLIFNQKLPVTCKQFAKVYDLNNIRPCPNILKLKFDYSKEEFWNQLFGPTINKNGYKYCFSDDEKLIKHIKEQWMVMHQHPKVLSTRMINKSKARKIVCEQKG